MTADPRFINRLEIGDDCFEIFITQDLYPEMLRHGVHMAGVAQLRPSYVVERTDPAMHTLLFTTGGQGRLTTTESSVLIEPGTMAAVPAQTQWRFEIEGSEWDMVWVLLPNDAHWAALMPPIGEVRPSDLTQNLLHLGHVIAQERTLSSATRETSFAKLNHYLNLALQQSDTEEDRLTRAFHQIEQALHKPWTVQDMAQLTFYSEPHLFRLCQQRYGMSPKQWLRQQRIERACQLLTQTDWPVAELAQRLGFSDPFNFSNTFKRVQGISPKAYRGRHGLL